MAIIIEKKGKMKFLNFTLVILLFLSTFQHFSLKIDFNSNEDSVNQLFSSLNSPDFNMYMVSQKNQGTDIFIQIEEIFEVETSLSLYLILFGTFTQNRRKYRDEQKEFPVKRMIIKEIIEQNPGIGLREIQRTTGFSMGVTQYHLRCLEAEEIESVKLGNGKHFFLSESHFSEKEKMWLSVSRNQNVRMILQLMGSNERQYIQKDVANCTGISKAMISYYVKQLGMFGIIDTKYHYLLVREEYIVMNSRNYWENRKFLKTNNSYG